MIKNMEDILTEQLKEVEPLLKAQDKKGIYLCLAPSINSTRSAFFNAARILDDIEELNTRDRELTLKNGSKIIVESARCCANKFIGCIFDGVLVIRAHKIDRSLIEFIKSRCDGWFVESNIVSNTRS